MKPKIFLGADHAGFELKEEVKAYLRKLGYEVEDRGAFKLDAEDDYPDFISAAAREVAKNLDNHKGIIFGGSGQGEAMVANKIKGIRAAVFNSDNPDIVKLSRLHNDSNVLSIGARFVSKETVFRAVKLWLETDFSNEARHKRRLKQIEDLENKLYK
ncbi:MAG TPA: RpiB/LacA/LacB family sugar-phosphate isomerase [Candidatus Nanoarchaeia archaeon]|nr:RpiB/LacA/LacB family sugar-phosphate isomerase [Candidatus Nanoarchaeia archaeon]